MIACSEDRDNLSEDSISLADEAPLDAGGLGGWRIMGTGSRERARGGFSHLRTAVPAHLAHGRAHPLPPLAISAEDEHLAVQLIATALREADVMAELVIGFLEGSGLVPPAAERDGAPIEFPREFLLELGAVLRIASWDRAGIRETLDPGLPSGERAYAEFLRRARWMTR